MAESWPLVWSAAALGSLLGMTKGSLSQYAAVADGVISVHSHSWGSAKVCS